MNHKLELLPWPLYDTDHLARHLERQAARGWLLEREDRLGLHFRKAVSKNLRYAVVLSPDGTAFSDELSEPQREFSDYCARGGWTPVSAHGSRLIFSSAWPSPVPIHTDPDTALRTLDRAVGRNLIFSAILTVLGLTASMVFLRHTDALELLLHPDQGLLLVICLLLAAIGLADLLPWAVGRLLAGAAARRGEFRSISGLPWLMPPLWLLLLAALAARCVVMPRQELLLILLPLALLLLYFGARLLLGRRGDTGSSRPAAVWLLTLLLLAPFFPSHGADPLPEAAVPLDLSVRDLAGEQEAEYHRGSYLWASSPFVTESHYYEQVWDIQNGIREDLPHLDITLWDIHAPWARGLCLRSLLHDGPWQSETPPAGADALYTLDTCYLLCWEDRIAQVTYSQAFTPDQLALTVSALSPEYTH